MRGCLSVLIAVLLLAPAPTPAQEDEGAAPPPEADPVPELAVTRHEADIADERLRYTATTGFMPLAEEDGTHLANVFFIAYTLDGADPATRPVTFAFNGGPGSSSVWLHLGALGPRRVVMGPEGAAPKPPYRLEDNEHSWLSATDLVFIDPVTTGYSRATPGRSDKQFHGVEEDVRSVGEFIRLYTTRMERWASPKFLAGESYGTTRAAGLAGHLQERHGMFLNGIMLISSILDFQTARFDVGNDLPNILFLPTYAATAWHHRRLEPELQERDLPALLEEVEEFALTEYAVALLRGDDLPAAQRSGVARRLARYTGLSVDYIEDTNLRIEIFRFTKELLRELDRTVGRLDSRFEGIDRDAAGERFEYDPSMAAISGPYTATLNDYVRRELDFQSDLPYEILTGRVRPWSYGDAENRYLNVAETLRGAMTRNRSLRVFVANGYYDLATPYFATEYTFDHLFLDPSLQDNVEMAYYRSGHMMYISEASLEKLTRDVSSFIRRSVERPAGTVTNGR